MGSEDKSTKVELILEGQAKDLGGFQVRRVFPVVKKRSVGPWVFFDHMGPAVFDADSGMDVRPHPHINLATVTYLFEGEIFHRDSLGNAQSIFPGDINLMIAGHGITHSERERDEVKNQRRRLNGLQLWMALPEEYEEMEPDFLHYSKEQIPKTVIDGVSVRVLIGRAYGLESPVKRFGETLYVEANLTKGQKLTLPNSEERGLYLVKGSVQVSDKKINEFSMAILTNGDVEVTALEDSVIALVGGENYGQRHLYWNFVSSRPERIEEAKRRWKNKEFPLVPGDEEEFIPLPAD